MWSKIKLIWNAYTTVRKVYVVIGLVIALVGAYQLNNYLVAKNANKELITEINKKTTTNIIKKEKEYEDNENDIRSLDDDDLTERVLSGSRKGHLPEGLDRTNTKQGVSTDDGQEVQRGHTDNKQEQEYPSEGVCEYPEVEVIVDGKCVIKGK